MAMQNQETTLEPRQERGRRTLHQGGLDSATIPRIAVLTATNAIEPNFFKRHTAWRTLQPITEKELMKELTRAFVAYLKSAA